VNDPVRKLHDVKLEGSFDELFSYFMKCENAVSISWSDYEIIYVLWHYAYWIDMMNWIILYSIGAYLIIIT